MAQAAVSAGALGHSPLPTNPIAAEVWNQGEQVASTMVGQALSRQKLDASSVGANVVVLKDFDRLLNAKMIVPSPSVDEISGQFYLGTGR